MNELGVVFYHKTNHHELAAYTLRGTFSGEMEATVELLSAERGIPKEEIWVILENRGGGKA